MDKDLTGQIRRYLDEEERIALELGHDSEHAYESRGRGYQNTLLLHALERIKSLELSLANHGHHDARAGGHNAGAEGGDAA